MNYVAFLGVALGGALGSVLRFAVQSALRPVGFGFPWGTLAVNVAGSFMIGLFAAWADRYGSGASWMRPWLITGFLGGFTTFSAFSLENAALLREGRLLAAFVYIVFSVAAGVALAFAGYMLARA